MKKLFILMFAISFFVEVQAQVSTPVVAKAESQKIDPREVPLPVTTEFNKTHSNVKDVEWRMDETNYRAKYEANDEDTYVIYSPTGEVVANEVELKAAALPPIVMEYVKKTYDEDELRDLRKVTDSKGTITYEGEVKGNNLIFDEKGNFIKAEKK